MRVEATGARAAAATTELWAVDLYNNTLYT